MKSAALSVPLIVLGILLLGLAVATQIGPLGFPGDSRLFSIEIDRPVAPLFFAGAAFLFTGIAVEAYARKKK